MAASAMPPPRAMLPPLRVMLPRMMVLLVVAQLGHLLLGPWFGASQPQRRAPLRDLVIVTPPQGQTPPAASAAPRATSAARRRETPAPRSGERHAAHELPAPSVAAHGSSSSSGSDGISSKSRHPACSESPSEALRRARQTTQVPDEWHHRRETSFSSYIKLHRAFVARGSSAATAHVPGRGTLPRRFLLVKPCCQLCNRVRVLIAALALGMLTDRAVLIEFDGQGHDGDYYGHFDDLFDSPLKVQARLPRDVQARLATVGDAAGAAGEHADGGEDGASDLQFGSTIGRQLTWLTMMSDFMCMDPLGWRETAVTIQGSPGFLHALYLSPSLRSSFDKAFGGLDGLFAAIFYKLLRPRSEIVEHARAFVGSLLSAPHASEAAEVEEEEVSASEPTGGGGRGTLASFVVGLHVRNGRDFRTKKLLSDEWRRLASCAQALVPDARTDAGAGGAGGAARYVVATESGESRSAAATAFGSAAAFYKEPLHKGRDGGTTSPEGAKRALLELLLVTMSNVSVFTPMSSFSETAAALSGRPGLYFHFDLSRKFHFETATEALPGCFVPWTAEMPGSMNLHTIINKLPNGCAESVRRADGGGPWTAPCGLRFLDGGAKLPERLAKKVTAY